MGNNIAAESNLQQPVNENSFLISKWKLIIFAVVSLILVGGGTYYLGAKQNKLIVQSQQQTVTPTIAPSTPTPTPDPTANWKTYINTYGNYEVKYPSNWTAVDGALEDQQKGYLIKFSDVSGRDKNNAVFLSGPAVAHGAICLEVEKSEKIRVSGIEATKTIWFRSKDTVHCGESDPREKITSVYFVNPKKDIKYSLEFRIMDGNFVLVDQILSTFKFTDQNQTTTLTPDQIFSEASLQLGITRSKLTYFRIFGQDKIQYSFGSGTNFAYKYMGKWQIAGGENAQGIAVCSELSNVPEQYRPPCYDSTTKQEKYMDSQRQSLNYPPSQMTSYIGE